MTDEKDIKVRELEARNELSRIAYNQIEERVEKLKAENAELKDKLAKYQINERWQDNQAQQMITNQTEIILRLNGEIRDLKAQLSESQEKVEELEDGIEGLNEDEFGRKL